MNESEHSVDTLELESLAGYLLDNQNTILAEWQEKIKKAEDVQVSILAALSQRKFYDHIPDFLEQMCKNLLNKQESLKDIAKLHGAHRWEHGIDLREVVNEWNTLHLVLIDSLFDAQRSASISQSAMAEAQKRLAKFINKGIGHSINEFYRLQRREAEEQSKALESVVREKEQFTIQRSQNLQEASHDLKGSMTAIQLNLYLLKKTDLGKKARELVEKLSLAAESQNKLLNELLDLSRLDAGQEQPDVSEFDAARLLMDLTDTMQPVATAKNLDLRYAGEESLVVRGDSTKVRRIAQNLLLNALKYTNEGSVEVTWHSPSDDQWELSIADTGPGMDFPYTASQAKQSSETKHPKAEQKNQNTEIPMPGEGIGLLIVRRLCELLNAIIDIESREEEGTTIRITFPRNYSDE